MNAVRWMDEWIDGWMVGLSNSHLV